MRVDVLKAGLAAGAVVLAVIAFVDVPTRDLELPPVYPGLPAEVVRALAAPIKRPSPTPTPTPSPSPCVGSIREYCAPRQGRCPTYAESLASVKASYCKEKSPYVRVVVEDCVGRYHSISVSHLFGGALYFDTKGDLIAAYQFSDAMGSYCNGASSSKTFGTIPGCTTEFVKIDFCK